MIYKRTVTIITHNIIVITKSVKIHETNVTYHTQLPQKPSKAPCLPHFLAEPPTPPHPNPTPTAPPLVSKAYIVWRCASQHPQHVPDLPQPGPRVQSPPQSDRDVDAQRRSHLQPQARPPYTQCNAFYLVNQIIGQLGHFCRSFTSFSLLDAGLLTATCLQS